MSADRHRPDRTFSSEWTPSRAQLLRFSGLTWNSHLIHVSSEHARVYGLDDVVVHAQLHACVLVRLTLAALGPGWRLRRLSWQNLAPAYVDQPLSVTGTVTATAVDEADVELTQRRPDGVVCVAATLSAVAAEPGGVLGIGTGDESGGGAGEGASDV